MDLQLNNTKSACGAAPAEVRCARRKCRYLSGFTILELLISIGVIAVLIALIVPALMSAREAARCVQCKSNLREIGVAMQYFHGDVNKLPPAWNMTSDKVSAFGWATSLLPQLEQQSLYKQINLNLSVAARENDQARSADLPLMHCPSDISEPNFELVAGQSPHHNRTHSAVTAVSPNSHRVLPLRLPSSNYLGVYGTVEADENFPAPAGDGAIVAGRDVRYSDLERGQSHTVVVGERTAAMAPSTWYGVHFRGEDAACRLVGSTITAPNCTTCDECEFSSRHAAGSNFVWADGHVSLVEANIQSREYQLLAKRRNY